MNTFQNGERVIIIDGPFVGMEAQVKRELDSQSTVDDIKLMEVIIRVFGRDIPVVLESWQIARG